MCDDIYIGNTHQTFKKKWTSFIQSSTYTQERKKQDSCAAHFKQNFNATTTYTDLHKYMTFKVLKMINLIGSIKKLTKPNFKLCIEERLTILKKLRDKHVTIVNKNLEMYEACRDKTTFYRFFLSTDEPAFNG